MYIRILRGRFNPTTEAEVLRVVETHVLPAMQHLPGFQRYLGGLNRHHDTLTVVTLWDTEAHADFSHEVMREVLPALTTLRVVLEPSEIYAITVDVSG
jgi:hypothetical protein